ncbi:MAG: hypothetical protein WCP19_06715 [Chloroflexota bacterium]
MFEDLRNIADGPSNFDDPNDIEIDALQGKSPKIKLSFNPGGGKFLGMTAFQRFIISLLLFLLVIVIGSMALMISSSMLIN